MYRTSPLVVYKWQSVQLVYKLAKAVMCTEAPAANLIVCVSYFHIYSHAYLRMLQASARALARAVGYVGAATVEYLYVLGEQKYYFLELNPRLQVGNAATAALFACSDYTRGCSGGRPCRNSTANFSI